MSLANMKILQKIVKESGPLMKVPLEYLTGSSVTWEAGKKLSVRVNKKGKLKYEKKPKCRRGHYNKNQHTDHSRSSGGTVGKRSKP